MLSLCLKDESGDCYSLPVNWITCLPFTFFPLGQLKGLGIDTRQVVGVDEHP